METEELLQKLLSIFRVNHKIYSYQFKKIPLFRYDIIVMGNSNCATAEKDSGTRVTINKGWNRNFQSNG
jgi:hypothetical protein